MSRPETAFQFVIEPSIDNQKFDFSSVLEIMQVYPQRVHKASMQRTSSFLHQNLSIYLLALFYTHPPTPFNTSLTAHCTHTHTGMYTVCNRHSPIASQT